MLDSFEKESKLQERKAARQRQMRLMEEAASGLPLSASSGLGDGYAASVGVSPAAKSFSGAEGDGLENVENGEDVTANLWLSKGDLSTSAVHTHNEPESKNLDEEGIDFVMGAPTNRLFMNKAERERDNDESRRLILMASRRLSESTGGKHRQAWEIDERHNNNRRIQAVRDYGIWCPSMLIMNRKLLGLALLAITLVIILVTTVSPTNDANNLFSVGHEPQVTREIDMEKFSRIKDRLLEHQISHASHLEDESSPQYKALVWIVRDDERQLDIVQKDEDAGLSGKDVDEELTLFQRYALAVLWFQTTDLNVLVEGKKEGIPGAGRPEADRFEDGINGVYSTPPSPTEGDIEWDTSTNWLSSKGICVWYGVTCHPFGNLGTKFDGDFYVAKLNLTDNNLNGVVPKEVFTAFLKLETLDLSQNMMQGTIGREIGQLTELEDLFLSSNRFTGSIPPEIGNCINLYNLYLNDNQFRGSIPERIGDLTKLRGASLFNNYFDGEIPKDIGNLKDLVALYLDVNQLNGQIPTTIGQLTQMVDLRLRRNNLSGSIPTELGNLKYLQTLYLDTNPLIKGRIPSELSKLGHLDELHLYQNSLSGSLPSELGLLNELEYLYLDANELTGPIPEDWGGMRNLEQLFLAGNNLNGTLPITIRGMGALQQLRLSDNELSGEIPSDMGKMLKLESVYLEENRFSGAVPSAMGELTKLKKLHLHDNDFSGVVPPEVCKLVDSFFLREVTADCKGSQPDISCSCCKCQ